LVYKTLLGNDFNQSGKDQTAQQGAPPGNRGHLLATGGTSWQRWASHASRHARFAGLDVCNPPSAPAGSIETMLMLDGELPHLYKTLVLKQIVYTTPHMYNTSFVQNSFLQHLICTRLVYTTPLVYNTLDLQHFNLQPSFIQPSFIQWLSFKMCIH
jgi:hypothetical protein